MSILKRVAFLMAAVPLLMLLACDGPLSSAPSSPKPTVVGEWQLISVPSCVSPTTNNPGEYPPSSYQYLAFFSDNKMQSGKVTMASAPSTSDYLIVSDTRLRVTTTDGSYYVYEYALSDDGETLTMPTLYSGCTYQYKRVH